MRYYIVINVDMEQSVIFLILNYYNFAEGNVMANRF
jgi:hypothetical protein